MMNEEFDCAIIRMVNSSFIILYSSFNSLSLCAKNKDIQDFNEDI